MLLLKVGVSDSLEGVFFPIGKSKVETYADDTTIGIERDESNLTDLNKIINDFQRLSGLGANLDQTHVIPVGPIDDPSIELCKDFKLHWTSAWFYH